MKNIPCYDVPHGTLDLILQGEMQHIQRALRLVIRSHKCYCRMVCYPTVCVIHGTNQTIQSKLIQNKDWGCASNAWRLTGRDLNSLIKIKTVFQTNLIINCTIFAKPKVMLSKKCNPGCFTILTSCLCCCGSQLISQQVTHSLPFILLLNLSTELFAFTATFVSV